MGLVTLGLVLGFGAWLGIGLEVGLDLEIGLDTYKTIFLSVATASVTQWDQAGVLIQMSSVRSLLGSIHFFY